MSDLSAQLAALGIANAPPGAAPALLTDELDALLASAFPHGRAIDRALALDVHHLLGMWRERLEHRLAAEHGAKAITLAKPPRESCQHTLVEVDATKAYLTCRTCGALVGPIAWLSRNVETIARSEAHRSGLKLEQKRLADEIEGLKRERTKLRQGVRRARDKAQDPPNPTPSPKPRRVK